MFALINDARLSNGKSTVGFINPALYTMYYENQDLYFNDITDGYNEGCVGDSQIDDEFVAFTAAEGWDATTGVGTPKFETMYQYFVAL